MNTTLKNNSNSMKRYLLLWRRLFEGIPIAPEDYNKAEDILIYQIKETPFILKNGIRIIKSLTTLVEKHKCGLVFLSEKPASDSIEKITRIRDACKRIQLNFPNFVAMTVRDEKRYSGASFDAPFLEVTKENVLIAGYSDGGKNDKSYRIAAQRILNISNGARKFHFFGINDFDLFDKATVEEEGWQPYIISEEKGSLSFAEALEKIEKIVSEEQIEFYDEQLEKLFQEPIQPQNWQKEISRDKGFQISNKKILEDSEYLHYGIYHQNEPHNESSEWLGICISGIDDCWDNACKSKIAADFYGCFGAQVVEIKLSAQKTENPGDEEEFVHIMSRIPPNLKTYKEACGSQFDPQNPLTEGKILFQNGRSLEERGLGHILAVAAFINDDEPFGKQGNGIGFQEDEEGYAKTIKLAPSRGFGQNESEKEEVKSMEGKERVIRVGKGAIEFNSLSARTRQEFLVSLHKIVKTGESDIEKFFNREGAEKFCELLEKTSKKFTEELLARRKKLKELYKADLEEIESIYQKKSRE